MNKNKNDLKLYKTTIMGVFTVQLCNDLSHKYVPLVSAITRLFSLDMYVHTKALSCSILKRRKPIIYYWKYYLKI